MKSISLINDNHSDDYLISISLINDKYSDDYLINDNYSDDYSENHSENDPFDYFHLPGFERLGGEAARCYKRRTRRSPMAIFKRLNGFYHFFYL